MTNFRSSTYQIYSFLLPATQSFTVFCDNRVIVVGHLKQVLAQTSAFDYALIPHFIVILAVSYIFFDRAMNQPGLLQSK